MRVRHDKFKCLLMTLKYTGSSLIPPPKVPILLLFWENLEDHLFEKGGPDPHSPCGYATAHPKKQNVLDIFR